jgi:regulator of cell morphogenesis and NO signaling
MQELNTKTIKEIAVEFPQTTRVFEEFKIDYCCGGSRKFEEACKLAGIEPQIVSGKIEQALSDKTLTADEMPEQMGAAQLIDHIVNKHHVFTKNEIARLTPLMDKVCRKHGPHHKELFVIQTAFNALADELLVHMRKEEMVLFPFIKVLAAVVSTTIPVAEPHFKTVKNPIRMMMNEHDAAGDFLRTIREVSSDFTLPEGACPSYMALYFGLEELEKDLHQHIHLENNVLFPKAVELEQKVFGDDAAQTDSEFACQATCH